MSTKPIRVRVVRRLPAPARQVWDVLADYRHRRRAILPARAFHDVQVVRGGTGEGTVLRFALRAFGKVMRLQAEVRVIEPGRVLLERAVNGNGAVTTFVVEAVDDGSATVSVETRWTPVGRRAWVERLLAPLWLRRLHAEQLANLELAATGAA